MVFKKRNMYLNNQQSFIFGALIIGLLSFMACEETIEVNKMADFGTKTKLQQSEDIWFGADTSTAVHVFLKQIEDSRCPEDVQCVWAGEAKVNLLAVQKQDSVSLSLKLDSPTDTLSFSLGNKPYRAVLFEVTPYPNSKKNAGSKFATLTILNSN